VSRAFMKICGVSTPPAGTVYRRIIRMRLSIQVAVQPSLLRLRGAHSLCQNLYETDWTVFSPHWFNPRKLDDYDGLCRRVNNQAGQ